MSRTLSKLLAPAAVRLPLLEPVAPAACGAWGVDKPNGIRRQAPQALTKMTTGQSGAKAPDRNR